jgi:hypothetical protein
MKGAVNSAARPAGLERCLEFPAVKRSSLIKVLILLRNVNLCSYQQKQKEFV